MSRPRMYYKYELPMSVVRLVRAECADFDRREVALREDCLADSVRYAYEAKNEAIKAALEDVEEFLRAGVLADIAQSRGYECSPTAPYIGKKAYYNRKRKAMYLIAIALTMVEK